MATARFQLTIWHLIKLVVLCGLVAALFRADGDLLSFTTCAVGAAAIIYDMKARKTQHAGQPAVMWLPFVSIALVCGMSLLTIPESSAFRSFAPWLLVAAIPDSFCRALSSRLTAGARRMIYSLYPPHLTDESCGPIGWKGYDK